MHNTLNIYNYRSKKSMYSSLSSWLLSVKFSYQYFFLKDRTIKASTIAVNRATVMFQKQKGMHTCEPSLIIREAPWNEP